MIIVSQDRTKITEKLELSVIGNEIYFGYGVLGIYQTQERAKEVLEEIIERYTNCNNLVYGQPTGECSPKYEMPKE